MSEPAQPQPTLAQKAPFKVEVSSGKAYWWCACGQSQKQPFCDGSHKGSDFTPVKFTADKDRTVFFCGCKRTGQAPVCDGSHKAV